MNSGKQNQSQPDAVLSFEFKRAVVGGLSIAFLLLAILVYLVSADLNNVILAASLRIGVVLFATWLALPQLRGIISKLPDILPVAALVLIVLCAARPNLFRFVGSLIVIGTALVAISKWIREVTGKA